jgi:NADH-quinone oxidoreductase subunit E
MNMASEQNSANPALSGICVSCTKAEDCNYLKMDPRPRIYCEDFDDREAVYKIVKKHIGKSGSIIAILEEIQAKYSYLPERELRIVAQETERSLTDIYSVATFYRAFKLHPRGKHLISCCLGTACHVRGGPRVADEFIRVLSIKPGETTCDKEFTLETVNCLGACALGPVTVVDGHYFPQMNVAKISKVIDKVREGLDKVEIKSDMRVFPVSVSCSRCNHSLMDTTYFVDGFPSIRVSQYYNHQIGWLRLSSLYGSQNVEMEFEVPKDAIIHLFCPYCHTELIGSTNCPECGVKMVPMIVRGGGIVQICPRRGCKGHLLDVA